VIHHSREHVSTAPMSASFTPLQTMLGIAFGDLRLVCGCSAIGDTFHEAPTNSSCADVASKGSLELSSNCCNQGQTIFTCCACQHSAVPFCALVSPTTSRLSRCCSLMFPLHKNSIIKLTGATLAGQKFDKLTCRKGGIL
jgi:hypothetical protein